MNLTGLIFLLFAHYFAGRGVIRLFRIDVDAIALLCLSMMCGVTIHSFVPCIMDLIHVPLTASNMYIWLGGTSLLLSIPLLIRIKKTKLPSLRLPQLYEVPFLLIFIGLGVISVWRCWYFPPTPRDVLTGVELIAEYAVKEKTMINSAFSVDVRLNSAANNIFKSPFITSLQVIYKLLVLPFGQLWLSILFLSFTTWFYTILRQVVHPLLAGMLLLIYFAVPDLYAYTYIILYDYSNMVFFFAGYYFMMKYMSSGKVNELLWVSFLFGLATYIRSETLVLAAFSIAIFAIYMYRDKVSIKQIMIRGGIFMAGPLVFNFILSNIFIKYLVPYKFKLGDLLNSNMTDIGLLFDKFHELVFGLMFSPKGQAVYADFYIFFLVVFVADLVLNRKISRSAGMTLWGVLIVFITLGVLSFLIPSHTVINSAKRGLFKLIPLATLYMAQTGLLQKLSGYLLNKENRIKESATAQPVANTKQPKKKK